MQCGQGGATEEEQQTVDNGGLRLGAEEAGNDIEYEGDRVSSGDINKGGDGTQGTLGRGV